MSPSDTIRAAAAPFDEFTGHRRFLVDTSPDSIDLAAGAYEVLNPGTVAAVLRIGSAVSVPADKAAEVLGQFVVPAGGAVTFSTTGTVHGVTDSGSTTLELFRKGGV